MDIAVVGVGVSLQLDADRQRCRHARIALAAVAPTPILVPEAAAELEDIVVDEQSLRRAASKAQEAAKPIDDMRGDSSYRKHLVGVLTFRALQQAWSRAKEKQ
jgi:carbon-monoxide dehydrogenase medium subunit